MRCFLACFGISKIRKHRKPSKRVKYANQLYGSYGHLDSDAKLDLTATISRPSGTCSKGKAIPSIGLKKKVSFNLEVQSYEPLPHIEFTSYFSEIEEDVCKRNEEEAVKTSFDSILDKLETETFPSDHRYQNWHESDDDMALEESDVDDYGSDGDDEEMSEEEYFGDSETNIDLDQLFEGEKANDMTFVSSLDQELNKLRFDNRAKRDRSEYVFSVLNPIENLAQWKAVKAKVPMPSKRQRKENTRLDFDCKADFSETKPLIQDTAVNTSLSNWLHSSK